MSALEKDEEVRPEVFVWAGPLVPEELDAWIARLQIRVPAELRLLWLRTGGGDIFETETILRPFAPMESGENVEWVTRQYRDRGLPGCYLIFHRGLGGVTAVRNTDGAVVVLAEDSLAVTDEFRSIEEWYGGFLREEYAERYGLPSLMGQS